MTVGLHNGTAQVWDPRDGRLRETIQMTEPGAFPVQAVRIAPDSRHLAAAMANGTAYIFRLQPAPEFVPEVTKVPDALTKGPEPLKLYWKDLVGQQAPEFREIKGWLADKPVRLADLRGRHLLIHFWNLRSEREMLVLRDLHERLVQRGLAIVVVCPDYGGTVESLRKNFTEMKRQWWGGQDLPFPVALDGGGETAITGTPVKARGATHAAYRIVDGHRGWRVDATTLLVDPEGTLVRDVPLIGDVAAKMEAILPK